MFSARDLEGKAYRKGTYLHNIEIAAHFKRISPTNRWSTVVETGLVLFKAAISTVFADPFMGKIQKNSVMLDHIQITLQGLDVPVYCVL